MLALNNFFKVDFIYLLKSKCVKKVQKTFFKLDANKLLKRKCAGKIQIEKKSVEFLLECI